MQLKPAMSDHQHIAGYDYGTDRVARSPVSMDELHEIERAAGVTQEDVRWLQRAGEILSPRAEEMVDAWRARIAAQPELARWFVDPTGKPDETYKAGVKRRFVQWVRDTCVRPRDRAWLDYQDEIGLRHTPAKKNRTEGAHTPPLVPLRYLIAFTPAVLEVRSFLAAGTRDLEDLQAMEAAWRRAVLVQIAIWCRAYTRNELW